VINWLVDYADLRTVQRFRGGLVFKAHRLLYHSSIGLRVIKKEDDKKGSALDEPGLAVDRGQDGCARLLQESEFFIDNPLVRIHFVIEMIRWTGLAPWEFEFSFPGSLISTFLGPTLRWIVARIDALACFNVSGLLCFMTLKARGE